MQRKAVVAVVLLAIVIIVARCTEPTPRSVARQETHRALALPRITGMKRLDLPSLAARALHGRVTTPSGIPIEGARIVMRGEHDDDEIDEVVTDEAGRYAFAVDVAAGQLFVSAAGFASQRRPFSSVARVVDFRLIAGASIRGRVVRVDEVACAEAEVWIETYEAHDDFRPPSEFRRTTVADRDGTFAFEGLPPGALRISARGVGCATSIGTDVTVGLGARLDDVRVIAERGFTVRGIAVRRGTNTGVAGVELGIDVWRTQPAISDRDGRFVFHGVAEGSYPIHVRTGAVAEQRDEAIVVDRDRNDVRIEVDLGRTLRGRIEPARIANIVVPRDANGMSIWDAETESAPDGTFELRSVPTGKQVLRAYTDDGLASDLEVSGDGDLRDLVIALHPIGDATLHAHVVDEDGQPVPFARFSTMQSGQPIHTMRRTVTTDARGALVIANVTRAGLWIAPDDHALANDADVVLVPDDTDHEIIVRRPDSRVIRGFVRDPHGVALAGVRVHAYPAQRGPVGEAVTDAAGRFEIGALATGAYELRAATANRDARARVTVERDELATIVLAPVYRVELRVTAHGAAIRAYDLWCAYDGQSISARSSALHAGRLESQARGPVECRVETATGTAYARGTFGDTTVLELPMTEGARVSGRVVDAQGKPYADASEPYRAAVTYVDDRGFLVSTELDATGHFELRHLIAGRGTLRHMATGTVLATITVAGDRDVGTLRLSESVP